MVKPIIKIKTKHRFAVNYRKLFITILNLKKTAYHHYGNNLLSIFKFIYYSVIRINNFFVYEKQLNNIDIFPEIDPDFNLVKVDVDQLVKIREAKDLPREFYCDDIYGLKTCYLGFMGDHLAYIQWVIFNDEYSRFLSIPADAVEFNYIMTLKDFRGKSLTAQALSYVSYDFKNRGYKKAAAVIHEENIPSLKSFEKAGFRRVANIKALGPFNKKFKIKI